MLSVAAASADAVFKGTSDGQTAGTTPLVELWIAMTRVWLFDPGAEELWSEPVDEPLA